MIAVPSGLAAPEGLESASVWGPPSSSVSCRGGQEGDLSLRATLAPRGLAPSRAFTCTPLPGNSIRAETLMCVGEPACRGWPRAMK